MKKHTHLLKEIYHGKKPSTDWYNVALSVISLIAFAYIVYVVVSVVEYVMY